MAFADVKIHVRLKLFGLWCSVLFFYLYGDYFQLYQPGQLQGMLAGTTSGSISQTVLLGMSGVMILPSLMPVLTLILPEPWSRRVNIAAGGLYTVIMILAIRGGWRFYILYGLIEIVLTSAVVWYAWKWPRQSQA